MSDSAGYDFYFLDLCYQLALQNSGRTAPNPAVGAAIVKNGKILGVGSHAKAGEEHAEVIALQASGDEANGSTLYCSLEPCNHQGLTGPCTEKIFRAGITRVVYAVRDLNPEVNGKGHEKLLSQGLSVDHIPTRKVESFYAPFFLSLQNKRPYMISKVAMTANGIISPADRNSRWITNDTSRIWVQHLRAKCDAIIIGADTVILDRPVLTIRVPSLRRQPLRIVIDSRLKIHPDNCSLLESAAPLLIAASETASVEKEEVWKQRGIEVIRFQGAANLLEILARRGIRKMLIEGGQKIFTLFHSAGLVDEYVLMLAPKLLTGKHFLNMLGGPEQSLHDAHRFHTENPIELDGDVVLRMRR